MKRFFLIAIIAVLFAACGSKQTVLTVEEFTTQAPELLDQTVTVKGVAKHICQNSGRKVFLASTADSEQTVTVFTGENMNPFDKTTVGKTYTMTGVVKVLTVIDEEYLNNWESQVRTQIAGGTGNDHHCSMENGVSEEGTTAENTTTEAVPDSLTLNNPQLKQIEEMRNKIAAQDGKPITMYKIECTSFTVE